MTKNSKKLPALIGLAILSLTYLCNIFLNAKIYSSSNSEADELLLQHMVFESLFWVIPVTFLLIWQKKAQTRVLSAPALILVGIVPMIRLISFLTMGILFDHGRPEWLVTLVFTLFAILTHPLVYMLIQTIFITILWFGFFFRGED